MPTVITGKEFFAALQEAFVQANAQAHHERIFATSETTGCCEKHRHEDWSKMAKERETMRKCLCAVRKALGADEVSMEVFMEQAPTRVRNLLDMHLDLEEEADHYAASFGVAKKRIEELEKYLKHEKERGDRHVALVGELTKIARFLGTEEGPWGLAKEIQTLKEQHTLFQNVVNGVAVALGGTPITSKLPEEVRQLVLDFEEAHKRQYEWGEKVKTLTALLDQNAAQGVIKRQAETIHLLTQDLAGAQDTIREKNAAWEALESAKTFVDNLYAKYRRACQEGEELIQKQAERIKELEDRRDLGYAAGCQANKDVFQSQTEEIARLRTRISHLTSEHFQKHVDELGEVLQCPDKNLGSLVPTATKTILQQRKIIQGLRAASEDQPSKDLQEACNKLRAISPFPEATNAGLVQQAVETINMQRQRIAMLDKARGGAELRNELLAAKVGNLMAAVSDRDKDLKEANEELDRLRVGVPNHSSRELLTALEELSKALLFPEKEASKCVRQAVSLIVLQRSRLVQQEQELAESKNPVHPVLPGMQAKIARQTQEIKRLQEHLKHKLLMNPRALDHLALELSSMRKHLMPEVGA